MPLSLLENGRRTCSAYPFTFAGSGILAIHLISLTTTINLTPRILFSDVLLLFASAPRSDPLTEFELLLQTNGLNRSVLILLA